MSRDLHRFLSLAMGIPAARLLEIDEVAQVARETFYDALRGMGRDRAVVMPSDAALSFLTVPTWAHRETDPGAT